MVLLILLLVILGLGFCEYFWRIRKELPEGDGMDILISETVSVTADFLEAGKVVSLLSCGNYLMSAE